MLQDFVEVTIKAGHGGAGKVSFYPASHAGPDGGNGGRGGDVWVQAVNDLMLLNQFFKQKKLEAENGEMGMSNRKFGRDGKDLIINLPVGLLITDLDTGVEFELTEVGQKILIAKGGLGGRGNYEFKSPRNTTPKFAQPGLPGQVRNVSLNLRLIADIGLIGLPNSGKSSLLNELTHANAKVGNYPFTTLEPNLGELKTKIIADIPGLIEGAHEGKGLGIKFLKHIQKVAKIFHCLALDSENLLQDYIVVRNELASFDLEMENIEEIIVLTKSDLVDEKVIKQAKKDLKKFKREMRVVSIYDYNSIQELISLI